VIRNPSFTNSWKGSIENVMTLGTGVSVGELITVSNTITMMEGICNNAQLIVSATSGVTFTTASVVFGKNVTGSNNSVINPSSVNVNFGTMVNTANNVANVDDQINVTTVLIVDDINVRTQYVINATFLCSNSVLTVPTLSTFLVPQNLRASVSVTNAPGAVTDTAKTIELTLTSTTAPLFNITGYVNSSSSINMTRIILPSGFREVSRPSPNSFLFAADMMNSIDVIRINASMPLEDVIVPQLCAYCAKHWRGGVEWVCDIDQQWSMCWIQCECFWKLCIFDMCPRSQLDWNDSQIQSERKSQHCQHTF
jgi:hypothetical protein